MEQKKRWKYKVKEEVLVCEMGTNRMNTMGSNFLSDFTHFLQVRKQEEHKNLPVVLLASGTTFSAGMDLFELFDREKEESRVFVRKFLKDLGEVVMQFWQLPFVLLQYFIVFSKLFFLLQCPHHHCL